MTGIIKRDRPRSKRIDGEGEEEMRQGFVGGVGIITWNPRTKQAILLSHWAECMPGWFILLLLIIPKDTLSHMMIACTYNSLLSQYNIHPQWLHHVHCEKKLRSEEHTSELQSQ